MKFRTFLCLLLCIPSSFCLAVNPPLKILFIGNSLTYGNSLPSMLEQMANEGHGSKQLQVEMVTIGGATLQQHWFDGRALKTIKQGTWDYVVLQEHNTLGSTLINGESRISDPQTFGIFATLFDKAIKRVNAETLLFLTWADEDKPDDQILLNKAFVDIAVELEATIIPVGPVWQKVRQALPDLDLYLDDKLHPSAAGSYVAACVFYAHLLGENLVGKSGAIDAQSFDNSGKTRTKDRQRLVSITDAQARRIQTVAMNSRKNSPAFIRQMQSYARDDLEPPKLPKGQVDIKHIIGEWSGQLLFYRDIPATMTLVISRKNGEWQADQTIRLDNGDTVKATQSLWLVDGKISWSDRIADSYFVGVYQGASIVGEARGLGSEYLQPGSRVGSWTLEKIIR